MNNTAYLSYANMPFWNVLPMGIANLGGDTQVFTIPQSNLGGLGVYFNPQGQAAVQGWPSGSIWNNWGANNPYPYPTVNPNFPITNPVVQPGTPGAQGPQGPQGPSDQMAPRLNNQADQMIYKAVQANLAKADIIEQNLNSILATSELSDEERAKVDTLLQDINTQETLLHNLLSQETIDRNSTYTKLQEIEIVLKDIMAEASKIQRKKKKQENANSTESYSNAALTIADSVSAATEGTGTDNEKLEGAIGSINKDNVLEVVLAWQDTHAADHAETLFEAVLNDATEWDSFSRSDSQKAKLVRQIAHALQGRAQKAGVYEDCKADFDAIKKEVNDSSFNIDDDVCKDALIKIAKKIAEAEGRNFNP